MSEPTPTQNIERSRSMTEDNGVSLRGREGGVTLTIPVKGQYFDQIAAGEKPEEYRLFTSFWIKRLRSRHYDRIALTRGYPKGGGVEGVTRLTRQWRGTTLRTITHPHFGPDPVMVFAIDVSQPEQFDAQ